MQRWSTPQSQPGSSLRSRPKGPWESPSPFLAPPSSSSRPILPVSGRRSPQSQGGFIVSGGITAGMYDCLKVWLELQEWWQSSVLCYSCEFLVHLHLCVWSVTTGQSSDVLFCSSSWRCQSLWENTGLQQDRRGSSSTERPSRHQPLPLHTMWDSFMLPCVMLPCLITPSAVHPVLMEWSNKVFC